MPEKLVRFLKIGKIKNSKSNSQNFKISIENHLTSTDFFKILVHKNIFLTKKDECNPYFGCSPYKVNIMNSNRELQAGVV